MKLTARALALASVVGFFAANPVFADAAGSSDATQEAPNVPDLFADINGARIHCEIAGDGTPLVLIHGYPLSNNLFNQQQKELSKSFKVITLDLRGFGRSTTPNDQGSIETYARDVLALLDMLGIEKAIIGGHSMGGFTTLELYKQAPDRFLGMLLIDTAAIAAAPFEQGLWNGYAEQVRTLGVSSIVASIVPEMLTGRERKKNPALATYLGGEIEKASANGAVGGAIALATRSDYVALLPSIVVPALIIVGIEDTLTPVPLSEQLKMGIPNSTLAVIRGGSHAVIIEDADRANRAIRQWAKDTGLLGGS